MYRDGGVQYGAFSANYLNNNHCTAGHCLTEVTKNQIAIKYIHLFFFKTSNRNSKASKGFHP